jgi:hypothetical protein
MVNIIFLFVLFLASLSIPYFYIREHLKYKKFNKKFNKYIEFRENIMNIVEEIDPIVREDFIKYAFEFILESSLHKGYNESFDIDEEEKKLYKKWGKYIPSYITNSREEKLKELGI